MNVCCGPPDTHADHNLRATAVDNLMSSNKKGFCLLDLFYDGTCGVERGIYSLDYGFSSERCTLGAASGHITFISYAFYICWVHLCMCLISVKCHEPIHKTGIWRLFKFTLLLLLCNNGCSCTLSASHSIHMSDLMTLLWHNVYYGEVHMLRHLNSQ